MGCPIPIIHCDDCGPVKVPETDLPVELPEIDNISSKGLNLSTFSDWMAVKCPKCSKDATRETDTFDTFLKAHGIFYAMQIPMPMKLFQWRPPLIGCRLTNILAA